MKGKLFLFSLIWSGLCFGQKPALTLESYKSWSQVNSGGLSPNGHFAFYTVYNSPIGRFTFFLKSTTGQDVFSRQGLTDAKFSDNSHYLFGSLPGDSLLIYDLENQNSSFIAGLKGYELLGIKGKQYLLLKHEKDLRLCELTGKLIKVFTDIVQYKSSPSGEILFLAQQDSKIKDNVICYWTAPVDGELHQIYQGANVNNIIFNNNDSQIAFMVTTGRNNSIFHYKVGAEKAVLLADPKTSNIDPNFFIVPGAYWAFSSDDKRLFFSLKKIAPFAKNNTSPEPAIWNYRDNYLRSYYEGSLANNFAEVDYLSTVDIQNKEVKQLLHNDQRLINQTIKSGSDGVCLVETTQKLKAGSNGMEPYAIYSICFTQTGEMITIDSTQVINMFAWNVSPTGRYILYFDPSSNQYKCFDTKSRNVNYLNSNGIPGFTEVHYKHYVRPQDYTAGITGWLTDEKAVLINSTYDIFQLDPAGKKPPINVTKGVGAKNKIVFSLAMGEKGKLINTENDIILSAFNTINKDYGFYNLDVSGSGKLRMLSTHSRYITDLNTGYNPVPVPDIVPCVSKNTFLVRFQNANDAPNYFFTKDLTAFSRISDIQPQKSYNWYTSELHTYTDSSGKELQGLLYKPQNFDPQKKYPILFTIYESMSDGLNAFIAPDLVGANYSIPIMVSNGYLVFLPDIKGKIGYSGQAALQCVNAAADHIAKFSWVDTTKMGLAGHSFGGFEANFILTHSSRFAAILSGAGISDMVSFATGLWGTGESKAHDAQYSYFMMKSSLADDPDSYLRNSPILFSKRVTTPVLFMHNDRDEAVDYVQTRSFFILLRSLQKPCWWLNYKGQDHGVTGEEKQIDFNRRTWQFLDHYLKGAPMPTWMKEHI